MYALLIWVFASDPTGGVTMTTIPNLWNLTRCEAAAAEIRKENPAFNAKCLRVK